jgi:hypothetical protein
MMDRTRLRDDLSRLLGAASFVFMAFWLIDERWPTLPRSPIFRMGVAFLVVGLIALVTPPGAPRRRMRMLLLVQVVCAGAVAYGDRVGLLMLWQRAVLGAALAALIVLVFDPPGYVKRWLDRRRERRKRA